MEQEETIVAPDPGVAAPRPAGLVLAHAGGEFRISVADDRGGVVTTLGPYAEEEVIAIWRRLAASSGLPLLFVTHDGSLRQLYPQIGRLRLGNMRDGKRLVVLSGRRPRFLVRRKAARLPVRPHVVTGRELARGRSI